MALRRTLSALVVGSALVLGLGLPGCGSDDPAQGAQVAAGSKDTIEYELGPRTKELTATDVAALKDGADQSQVLKFDAAVGAKFARGDVILAGKHDKTPHGLLRVVTGTTTVGGVVEVATEQAPLQLAFKKLNVHVERTLDVAPTLPAPLTGAAIDWPVGGTAPINEFIFNGDGDPATLEDQLHVDDRFEGKLGVSLDIHFEWGFVEEIIAGIDNFLECGLAVATLGIVGDCPKLTMPVLEATFSADAMVAAAFDHAGAASATYGTGPFPVGPPQTLEDIWIGPLMFVPEIGFEGEMKGKAGSYSRFKGSSRAGLSVGATVSTKTGFTPKFEPQKEFEVDVVEAYLDGHVTTSVGPTLSMLAYGAIGPTFGVSLRSDLDVDRTRKDDCYRASLSLDAYFGFKVKIPWRAVGEFFGGPEIGEDVEWVARKFGLDGNLLYKRVPLQLATEQVGQGVCTIPPPGMLPPGAPPDDTLANPPFTQWSRRYDDPGHYFTHSAAPHRDRTRLVPSVDGHLWAPASPSPTLRRIAIDGRQLSAVRYLAPIPEEDNRERPLPVAHLFERQDLVKWVLFENGTVGRLNADNVLGDSFSFQVPHTAHEEVHLRRGAVRPDGRTALVFGIRGLATADDLRMVLVELDEHGVVLRSRALGPATVPTEETQRAFFTSTEIQYRPDGTLLIGGENTQPDADAKTLCMALSILDDGSIGWANSYAPGGGECRFGGMSVTDNTDVLLTAHSGNIYGNSGYTIVLDANGTPKSSAAFQLGGDTLLTPLYVSRVSTSGYVVAGHESQSARQYGQFVVRLDAQGVPLTASSYHAPEGVELGFLDAYVTKDAGVLFASLADWRDQAEGRDLARFWTGKAFAKDGTLPFNAASGVSMVTPTVSGNVLTTFATPLPYRFVDVPVTFTPKTPLRAEPLVSSETVFAP